MERSLQYIAEVPCEQITVHNARCSRRDAAPLPLQHVTNSDIWIIPETLTLRAWAPALAELLGISMFRALEHVPRLFRRIDIQEIKDIYMHAYKTPKWSPRLAAFVSILNWDSVELECPRLRPRRFSQVGLCLDYRVRLPASLICGDSCVFYGGFSAWRSLQDLLFGGSAFQMALQGIDFLRWSSLIVFCGSTAEHAKGTEFKQPEIQNVISDSITAKIITFHMVQWICMLHPIRGAKNPHSWADEKGGSGKRGYLS